MVDTVVEHVDAITRDGLRVTGPIDEFTVRVPAFTPQTLSGTWDEIILATKAHHTASAVPRTAPAPHRRRIRGVGTERAQRARDRGGRGRRAHGRRVRQLRRRLPGARRDSLRRPRRRGGRRDRRPRHAARHRDSRRVAPFRSARDRDAQHLGLPVGQGSLRGDALRHGADQRVDRRRARHARLPASVHRAGARDPGRRGGPRRSARGVRRVRPRGLPHHRTRRRGGALARRAGGAQPALGQVAQRHLAGPRGAEAAHRSRRAARHRRHARRPRPACRRRSPRAS